MRNYKTAPFDLEKALAGHMLVDGYGTTYTRFKMIDDDSCFKYMAISDKSAMSYFDECGQYGLSPNQLDDLSIYIPLTTKELALQKLDDALQACEDAVNDSDWADLLQIELKKLLRANFSSCEEIISSLLEPENPNP